MSDKWYVITPTSGNGNGKLTVSARANLGPDRSASVAVSIGNGRRRMLRISQAGMLTVSADLVNPMQLRAVLLQDDELYDFFEQIKRFDIEFSASQTMTGRFVAPAAEFSEDGNACFSEWIDTDRYGYPGKIRFIAYKLMSDEKKYIRVSFGRRT